MSHRWCGRGVSALRWTTRVLIRLHTYTHTVNVMQHHFNPKAGHSPSGWKQVLQYSSCCLNYTLMGTYCKSAAPILTAHYQFCDCTSYDQWKEMNHLHLFTLACVCTATLWQKVDYAQLTESTWLISSNTLLTPSMIERQYPPLTLNSKFSKIRISQSVMKTLRVQVLGVTFRFSFSILFYGVKNKPRYHNFPDTMYRKTSFISYFLTF